MKRKINIWNDPNLYNKNWKISRKKLAYYTEKMYDYAIKEKFMQNYNSSDFHCRRCLICKAIETAKVRFLQSVHAALLL